MYQSKLFQVLKSFTEKDWKEAKKFILIQIDPTSEPGILFSYILKYHKDLSSKNLAIEKVQGKLFADKSRKSIQNIMSKLLSVLQDYLRWNWLKTNEKEYELALLASLRERGIFKLFEPKSKEYQKLIKTHKPKEIWDSYREIRNNHMRIFSANASIQGIDFENIEIAIRQFKRLNQDTASFLFAALHYYQEFYEKDYKEQIIELKKLISVPKSNSASFLLIKSAELISTTFN